jgi:hypothetical protein
MAIWGWPATPLFSLLRVAQPSHWPNGGGLATLKPFGMVSATLFGHMRVAEPPQANLMGSGRATPLAK